jgi:hypothetical protein
MTDDERNTQDEAEGAQEALRDLEVDQDEADKVTGGLRRAGDPCDGGE